MVIMKSLHVTYDEANDSVTSIDDAKEEEWPEVCERFDDDVRRVKSVEHSEGYTALYICFDSENFPFYYLVQEDARLKRLQHKVFLSKLGMEAE